MGALTCRGVRRSAHAAAAPGHPLTPSRPPAPAPGRGVVPGEGARRGCGRWPGTVAFAEDVRPSQPLSAAAGGARAPRPPRCHPPRLTANVFFQGRRGFPAVFLATSGSRLTHARVQLFVLRFSPGKGPRHVTVRRVPVAEAAGALPPRASPPAAAVGRGSVGSFVAKHVLPWTSIIVTPSFQHLLPPHEKAEC